MSTEHEGAVREEALIAAHQQAMQVAQKRIKELEDREWVAALFMEDVDKAEQVQAIQGLQAQNHRLMTQLGEEIAESDELVKQRDDFTQQLAEQRAEIERLKCQWQPIETAPRDGTYILLGWFLEGGGGGHPEVAFWHSTKQLWCSSRLLNAEGYYSPTHWQPLPEPPKEIKPCA